MERPAIKRMVNVDAKKIFKEINATNVFRTGDIFYDLINIRRIIKKFTSALKKSHTYE